jgi:hypothetical protein
LLHRTSKGILKEGLHARSVEVEEMKKRRLKEKSGRMGCEHVYA